MIFSKSSAILSGLLVATVVSGKTLVSADPGSNLMLQGQNMGGNNLTFQKNDDTTVEKFAPYIALTIVALVAVIYAVYTKVSLKVREAKLKSEQAELSEKVSSLKESGKALTEREKKIKELEKKYDKLNGLETSLHMKEQEQRYEKLRLDSREKDLDKRNQELVEKEKEAEKRLNSISLEKQKYEKIALDLAKKEEEIEKEKQNVENEKNELKIEIEKKKKEIKNEVERNKLENINVSAERARLEEFGERLSALQSEINEQRKKLSEEKFAFEQQKGNGLYNIDEKAMLLEKEHEAQIKKTKELDELDKKLKLQQKELDARAEEIQRLEKMRNVADKDKVAKSEYEKLKSENDELIGRVEKGTIELAELRLEFEKFKDLAAKYRKSKESWKFNMEKNDQALFNQYTNLM